MGQVGYFGAGVIALLSFFWSTAVIIKSYGFFAGLVAVLVAPLTGVVGPIFVGVNTGNWILALIAYLGGGACMVLAAMGDG